MRERLVVGNWKMHTNLADAVVLATKIRNGMESVPSEVSVVVCPPTIWLYPIAEILEHSAGHLQLGAQNVWPGKDGRYTGEASAWMLAQMCQYVIIGHSERRVHQAEDNRLINQKVKAALRYGLQPILCIGEFRRLSLDKAGQLRPRKGDTASDIFVQLQDALAGITADEMSQVVIAYEPVWAIGANQPAELSYIDTVIRQLRTCLDQYLAAKVSSTVRFLYGGSVSPDSAKRLAHSDQIDGVLVGGESLKANEFLAIASAFHARRSSS